jgi:hypothetical protein
MHAFLRQYKSKERTGCQLVLPLPRDTVPHRGVPGGARANPMGKRLHEIHQKYAANCSSRWVCLLTYIPPSISGLCIITYKSTNCYHFRHEFLTMREFPENPVRSTIPHCNRFLLHPTTFPTSRELRAQKLDKSTGYQPHQSPRNIRLAAMGQSGNINKGAPAIQKQQYHAIASLHLTELRLADTADPGPKFRVNT